MSKERKKFGRKHEHRKAMFHSQCKDLIKYGSIRTTLAKAKILRTYIEPLITLGKKNTHSSRGKAFSILRDKTLVVKLFDNLAKKYIDRTGGYTQIFKNGYRPSDAAPIGIIKFVD